MALEELIFNSFHFGEGVVLLKNLFLTVSTLKECGDHKRTEFYHFLLWEGVWS